MCLQYGAHHESILTAMISSSNLSHNELSWRRIFRSREKKAALGPIRNIKASKLNVSANNYIELINWTDIDLTEPSFTTSVPTENIQEMIKEKTFSDFKIPALPCHTQSVARHIKLVTEASSSVCNHESREGFIRNKIASRAVMPSFDSKSEYRSLI